MEYQHKLLLISGLLVALALYFALTSSPQAPADTKAAEALLLKSAIFAKGVENYIYSYSEVSDGYRTTYTAMESGGLKMVEIQNPLSTKRIYFTDNDTVLCIRYPVNETCESVKGNPELDNYVAFAQTKLLNDTLMDRAKSNLEFLIGSGYLMMNDTVSERTLGQNTCLQVSYVIDYSNLSLSDAARFSIGSDSPRIFYLSACIDNQSGVPYESTLNYTDKNGRAHDKITKVLSYKPDVTPTIVIPSNISGDAIAVLRKEREQQIKLATCHTDKAGQEREKCVADIALSLKRKDLCDLAGSRRDRCLVSIVPLTKDATICPAINDPSFRDDCYIELAGAYKDSSYCANIKDQSKAETCQEVAKVPEEPPAGNETKASSEEDIEKFMEYIDKMDSKGNETTNVSGSGNATNSSG